MSALTKLGVLVARESGMRMGPNQMAALAAAVGRAARGDASAMLRAATADGGVLERLIGEVTVKETFFMRDAAQLRAIDWRALVEGARARGSEHVHVWSAGCATGEEPYTLAMLAAEALGRDRRLVKILGTDIATVALDHARRGRYGPRALRHLDATLIARHFGRDGEELVVAPHLRAMVEFRRHNLARDAIPSGGAAAFDLAVCRNALIYFDAPVVERVAGLLTRALRPGGTLLLGAADRLCVARRPAGAMAARAARPPGPIARSGPAAGRRPRRSRLRRIADAATAPPPAATAVAIPEDAAQEWLCEAVRLANEDRLGEAVAAAGAAVELDPMNATAHFVRGSAELARGEAQAAVAALRAALYVDGAFGLAAFQLGRAYDALGWGSRARRAYERALRTFDPDDDRHAQLLGQVDIGDVASACVARLRRSDRLVPDRT